MREKTKPSTRVYDQDAPSSDAARSIVPDHRKMHRLGERVQARRKLGKSRKAAVRETAKEEGCNPQRARSAHSFFLRFRVKDLARLGRMKTINGAPLPWGCLRSLSTVDISKLEIAFTFIEKHGFFEGAIEEALDISPVGEYRRGPRLTQPKSLDAGLRQIRSWSTGWLKRY